MLITEFKHDIKTVRPDDQLWNMKSGITITPRAGFEIDINCPDAYMKVLQECINRGWIKPVAYMRNSEAALEYLKC